MVLELRQPFVSSFIALLLIKKKTVMRYSSVMPMLSDTLYVGKPHPLIVTNPPDSTPLGLFKYLQRRG